MNTSAWENEQKIKQEAKQLIAQTKLIMDNLDTNNSTFPNNTRCLSPEFDTPKYTPSKKSNVVSLDKNLINVALLNSKTDMKLTIKHLSEKLAEIAQKNKFLEKELKERDTYISQNNKKLLMKNDEINKLNEIIINERADSAVVENLKLKRKVMALEQTIEENKRMYELIIKEYQDKLNNITESHTINVSQLNKIKESNAKLVEVNETMKNENNNIIEKMNSINERCNEYEQKNRGNEKELERSEDSIRVLIIMIKDLYKRENVAYEQNKILSLRIRQIIGDNKTIS